MPRKSRLDMPGALHHVMGRGLDEIKMYSDERILGGVLSDSVKDTRKKGVVRSRMICYQLAVKRMGYSGADFFGA